jgi:hypothetical protein
MEGQFKVFYWVTRLALARNCRDFPANSTAGPTLSVFIFLAGRSDSDFRSPTGSSVATDNQLIRYRWFGSLELFDFKVVLF